MSDGLSVCIGDPSHLTFSGSHIWCWHINSGAEESLLSEFDSDTTSDLFDLVVGVLFRINLDSSLGSSEWNVNNSALVCHESRQSLHFIFAHVKGITDSSLGWCSVLRMLRTPGLDNLELSVITTDWESDNKYLVDWLDCSEDSSDEVLLILLAQRVGLELFNKFWGDDLCSLVEVEVNHLVERWVDLLLHRLLIVEYLGVSIESSGRIVSDSDRTGASGERAQHYLKFYENYILKKIT
ncbi:hypothetical protein GCK72_014207 [Caenorhabditis remanei]|uniref:Uncharacterized protein n=1 Tax=Caenorhabditis remanei TaxID=31234 RepID=A0A6A5GSV4_CAERE|nr:hypothetical protein GCK72_014207 [Caenorhabditis remanei]KAF1757751.1 hypothetical protein GCK72_014207 [Caenorhabditis remanei]